MALSFLQDTPPKKELVANPYAMKEEEHSGSTENNNREVGAFPFTSALMGPLAFHASNLTSPLFGASPFLKWAPTPPASVEKSSGIRGKVFVCRICNNSFGYKHVLQNHERTHTGEKPFECPQCHKRFTRDHHLKTHMRLHTGEKPYHCPHCDRHFVQVANLRRHLRVHTGERPYACGICSSRFSDSNQLKAHILIHKGEKPFECASCRVRFRRRHHLLHHKCSGEGLSPESEEVRDEDEESNEVDQEEIGSTDPEETQILDLKKKPRERKPREIRRIVRLPLPLLLPEQTEPEDLSMSKHNNNNSQDSSEHTDRLVPVYKPKSAGNGYPAAASPPLAPLAPIS